MPLSNEFVSLPLVALVEDEAVLRNELAFQLSHLGFRVESFETAAQLYRRLAVQEFAALVLDIGLDGEDGFSICQYLRQNDTEVGIVFVTARGLRDDKLHGLDMGADAYLVKPIDIDELALILRRLTRHAVSAHQAKYRHEIGGWRLDAGSNTLQAPNTIRIRLTLNESRLLAPLFKNGGRLCSHNALLLSMGLLPEEFDKHRIEVVISRLRQKVLHESGLPLPVQAARGSGYILSTNMDEGLPNNIAGKI